MTLKSQIDRFSQNEENFNALITGSAGTTVDLGEAGVVKSVATVIGEIAPGVDKGAWATATAYVINDIVLESGAYYRCRENHTSGTFATDLTAGKWRLNQGGDSTILTHRGRTLDDAITARFDNVTQMIADVNLEVGDKVVTYANQNGAAVRQEWEIVAAATGTPDGGSYIDLTGSVLQAKQVLGSYVTPLHFGAVGDNVVDDTTAFQNAINAIVFGGVLYVPRGDYKLTSALRIDKPMTVKGGGVGSFINNGGGTNLIQHTTSENAITFVARTENYAFSQYAIVNVCIESLTIRGVDDASRIVRGIGSDTTVNSGDYHIRECVLRDVNFRHCLTATEYAAIAYLNDFFNTSVVQCTTGFSIQRGAASDNGGQTRFFGCSFALVSDACLQLQSIGTSSSGSFSLFGCTLSEAKYGIVVGEECVLHVAGCEFESLQGSGSGAGIYIEIAEANPNSSAAKSIVGNKFLNSDADIYINKTTTAFAGGGFAWPMLIESNTFQSSIALRIDVPVGHTGIDSKQFMFGATNAGLNGPVDPSQISTNFLGFDQRNIANKNVPTGDLVGTTDTQTLSNKTFNQNVLQQLSASFQNATKVISTGAGTVGNFCRLKFSENNDGTELGSITSFGSSYGSGLNYVMQFATQGTSRVQIDSLSLSPSSDNSYSCGSASNRWSVVYAGTGTINTSDERSKQQIQSIDERVLKAWGNVAYTQYKFNDAIEEKGDGARWHFGLIAQRVKEAFESEGLNAFDYGLLCYDQWNDAHTSDTVIDRYGIRYEEALALECAYLRYTLGV